MDNNGSEKKTRRPRIGQSQAASNTDAQNFNRYEKVNYGKPAGDGEANDSERHYRRSYDNNRQGGYNNRGGYGGYNNRQGGSYGNNRRNYRDYNNDYNNSNTPADASADSTAAATILRASVCGSPPKAAIAACARSSSPKCT